MRTSNSLPALQPRSAALPEMATAVLILNEDRDVEYANASAKTLFEPVDPVGCTMPALLTSCAATGGEAVFADIDPSTEKVSARIELADGRLLDGTLRSLSSGGFVFSLDDVTAYVRNAELAKRDALTGLPNRAALREAVVDRLATAARTGQQAALFYLDLDRFKAINDTLGHPVGDALLRKVADRLRSAIRDGDVAARLGGDEFAICQSGPPQPAAAISLATRLVDLIGRAYVVEGHIVHVGASVGLSMFPTDGVEPDVLFKNADLALYRAKAEGGSCYRFYEPGMDERMQARRAMEIDLRRALAFKELQLVYQPQVNLRTNSISGFEALIRWRHPERGILLPGHFIPLAEEIGVIGPIGEWVLRSACKQAAGWDSSICLAVNLSPLQFRGGKIVDLVISALAHSGLTASRLELEITESTLLDDTGTVLRALTELRSLGVRISMDDFGTGYSSLGYLQKFPFDKIKIDQSLVRNIDAQPGKQAMLTAIVALATSLGLSTSAEGVETPEELACVRAEGCVEAQGFLTGRPLCPQDAEALLAAQSF